MLFWRHCVQFVSSWVVSWGTHNALGNRLTWMSKLHCVSGCCWHWYLQPFCAGCVSWANNKWHFATWKRKVTTKRQKVKTVSWSKFKNHFLFTYHFKLVKQYIYTGLKGWAVLLLWEYSNFTFSQEKLFNKILPSKYCRFLHHLCTFLWLHTSLSQETKTKQFSVLF